jgi:hypothetical protein
MRFLQAPLPKDGKVLPERKVRGAYARVSDWARRGSVHLLLTGELPDDSKRQRKADRSTTAATQDPTPDAGDDNSMQAPAADTATPTAAAMDASPASETKEEGEQAQAQAQQQQQEEEDGEEKPKKKLVQPPSLQDLLRIIWFYSTTGYDHLRANHHSECASVGQGACVV